MIERISFEPLLYVVDVVDFFLLFHARGEREQDILNEMQRESSQPPPF